MVIMHFGCYEDQKLAGIILHLTDDKKKPVAAKPYDILEKFAADFAAAYQAEYGTKKVKECQDKKCICYNSEITGHLLKFCAGCGKPLIVIEGEESIDDVLRYLDDFFNSLTHEIPQSIVNVLEERGWEIWSPSFKADQIVWLSGVNLFFSNPEEWTNEFSKVENWK